MRASHTDGGVNLTGVARACGIEQVCDITDEATLQHFAELLHSAETTLFVRVAIRAEDAPRVLPPRDGVVLKTASAAGSGSSSPCHSLPGQRRLDIGPSK